MGNDDVNIYERAVNLNSLPVTKGESKDYIIADEPLGYGLYFSVESFSATTGRGLTSNFFNFNYQITGYSINDNLQSTVTIECIKAVTENINAVLNFRYCKFYGDVVEFDVTLPDSINKANVNLTIPPLKFNKKLIFSYITDDSYSIYQYIFAPINKRRIVRKFGSDSSPYSYYYHYGMEGKSNFEQYVKEAITPTNFLQCNDGCGVDRKSVV